MDTLILNWKPLVISSGDCGLGKSKFPNVFGDVKNRVCVYTNTWRPKASSFHNIPYLLKMGHIDT